MCGKSYGRKEKESNKDCKQERSQNWASPLREVGRKRCVNGKHPAWAASLVILTDANA